MELFILLSLPLMFLSVTLSSDYQVKESEIKFYLYTRNQTELQITPENICEINTSIEFRFIIHGWIASHKDTWVTELTKAYLNSGDFNVVHVDWSSLAAESGDVAVRHASEAAYYAAKFMQRLIKNLDVNTANIEIIAHSLGAHISGFISQYIKEEFNGRVVKKITAMDPANVQFEDSNGLQKTDAEIVVVIHTDGGGYGKKDAFGTVDFFPNGGSAPQPGCAVDTDCSHVIVTAFVTESVENPEAFLSRRCDSYENYLNGSCNENESASLGGNLEGTDGNYYFETNPQKPYSKN